MKTPPPKRRRALLVDDEASARKDLRELLLAHPEIEVVGEAKNVTEALDLYRSEKPDLIFLDVQMPRRDGFSLLPELQPVPDIIFVTGYDAFAVKAFEVNAVDYLIKPVIPERLALALAKINSGEKRKPKRLEPHEFIILHTDLEVRVVLPAEITHIDAEENYSRVHLANREPILMRRKMSEWMKILPPKMFQRPYRSLIVNRTTVKDLEPLPHNHSIVTFSGDDSRVELGRGASRRLRRALQTSP